MCKNIKEAKRVKAPKEGELFKVIPLGGRTFEIKYGYYEDYERKYGEPIPIYPDFVKEPCFADDGKPFVTQMQDACEHAKSDIRDSFCVECKHFSHGDELIGFCNHRKRKYKAK